MNFTPRTAMLSENTSKESRVNPRDEQGFTSGRERLKGRQAYQAPLSFWRMDIRLVRQHLSYVCRRFPPIFPATVDPVPSTALTESLSTTACETKVFHAHVVCARRSR